LELEKKLRARVCYCAISDYKYFAFAIENINKQELCYRETRPELDAEKRYCPSPNLKHLKLWQTFVPLLPPQFIINGSKLPTLQELADW
jgi:hypothetical protein